MEALAVRLQVEADALVRRDVVVLVDDGAAHLRSTADARALHDDAMLQAGVALDHDGAAQHGVVQRGPIHDAARAHHGAVDDAVLDLGRFGLVGAGVDGPVAVGHAEARRGTQCVEVRLVVGVDRADVAPVSVLFIGLGTGDGVGVEVVRHETVGLQHGRQDVFAEVAVAGFVGLAQGVQEDVGVEEVVAHGSERMGGTAGHRARRRLRLLDEIDDAVVIVRLHDAELVAVRELHGQRGHADVRIVPGVEIDHLAHVHAVDVVRAEHRDDVGLEGFDQVDVLVHRIRRALEPFRAVVHLGRHHGDEMLWNEARHRPGLADVLDQRLRLVLHQQIDRVDLGIDEVREHEIDDPVLAVEGHGRLAALCRERVQARAFAAGHDDGENVLGAGHGGTPEGSNVEGRGNGGCPPADACQHAQPSSPVKAMQARCGGGEMRHGREYPAMFCCAATKGCRKFLRGAVSGHLRADERARAPGRKILDKRVVSPRRAGAGWRASAR